MRAPTVDGIVSDLKAHGNPRNVEGMARFGIASKRALGVPTTVLRRLARELGKSHRLAAGLWETGILEAGILAAFIGPGSR